MEEISMLPIDHSETFTNVAQVMSENFVAYSRHDTTSEGLRSQTYLAMWEFEDEIQSALHLTVNAEEYLDGGLTIFIKVENSHVYPLESRVRLLELVQCHLERYRGPKVIVVAEGASRLKLQSLSNIPARSGISAEVFENFLLEFMHHNYSFLKWLIQVDHGFRMEDSD